MAASPWPNPIPHSADQSCWFDITQLNLSSKARSFKPVGCILCDDQVSSASINPAQDTRHAKRHNRKDSDTRYKTVLCKKWVNGLECPYGRKCQFAHGPEEQRARM